MKTQNSARIRVLKYLFLGASFVVLGRAMQLQLGGDERLARLAERQFNSRMTSLPRRGYIFDRNGEGLAISLRVRSLFLRPEIAMKELKRPERQRLQHAIAKAIHMPFSQVQGKFAANRGFVWVKRQLTTEEEKELIRQGVLERGDAIGMAEESKRFYPNKEVGAHVLGAVGVDGQGLEGLELFYDAILAGEKSKVASSRDAMGRRIFEGEEGLLAIKDGQSIVLTIDKSLQYETEKALNNAIKEYGAKAATAIVADVETGDILALANYPTYNPNSPRDYSAESRRNRAITDLYEPGSTVKPFIMAAALEHGKTPQTKVYCEEGKFKVADRIISEAETHEKFKWLTLTEILKHSSNIGSAKVALELGAANIGNLLDRLGVGMKTGIDLPGEVSGGTSRAELKSEVRLANIGFGHGLAVNSLQMLTYYMAIANGGNWVAPRLVKAVLSEDPDSIERGAVRWKLGHRFEQKQKRKVFDEKIALQVQKMLESVPQEGGTAVQAQLEEWPVAGKTGTAQKIDPKTGRYSREKHVTSFVGFAPAKSPRLVALVMLDEPSVKAYFATSTAAPTFREIMRASLIREQIEPMNRGSTTLQLANRSSLKAISKTVEASRPTSLETNPEGGVKMPDLKGLSIRETMELLGGLPLQFEVHGNGMLKEQRPAPGVWITSGKVQLYYDGRL